MLKRTIGYCAVGVAGFLGGCVGEIASPGPTVEGGGGIGNKPAVIPPFAPAEAKVRRLTNRQYQNSVRHLLGDVTFNVKVKDVAALNGLVAIGTSRGTLSNAVVEQFEKSAYDVLKQAFDNPAQRDRLVPCTPSDAAAADDACAAQAINALGRRAYRRALTKEETNRYVAIAGNAADTLKSFDEGLQFGFASILQSPHFLFRIELGVADAEHPGWRRYTDHETATRLSFFVQNTTPDDELLDAADRGELSTTAGIRTHVERMLQSPDAKEGVAEFFDDLLQLHELEDMEKNATLFPLATESLAEAMRQETLLSFQDLVFEQNAPFNSIFTTRRTFVNAELANLYGLTPPSGPGFEPVTLPSTSPRRGFLGHAGFLALHSISTRSSPTRRGVFIQTKLLCAKIPPPPNDVGKIPDPSPDAKTMRQRLALHTAEPACAGCHAKFDPIGLATGELRRAWRISRPGQRCRHRRERRTRRSTLQRCQRARRSSREESRRDHLSHPQHLPLRHGPPRSGHRGARDCRRWKTVHRSPAGARLDGRYRNQ